MNSEMKIIREVSLEAEACYPDAVKIGDHAAAALKARHRSQMTNLENIAESSFTTSDILDYIKKQIARSTQWRQPDPTATDPKQGFGERLLVYLEEKIPRHVNAMYVNERLGSAGTSLQEQQQHRYVTLLLMRQVIRSIVVQYEYRVNPDSKQQDGARNNA